MHVKSHLTSITTVVQRNSVVHEKGVADHSLFSSHRKMRISSLAVLTLVSIKFLALFSAGLQDTANFLEECVTFNEIAEFFFFFFNSQRVVSHTNLGILCPQFQYLQDLSFHLSNITASPHPVSKCQDCL